MDRDANAPLGWAVNPSAAAQRAPVVGLAALGFALAVLHVLRARGSMTRWWEPFATVDASGWVVPPPPVPWPALDLIGFAAVLATALGGSSDRWRKRRALVMVHGFATIAVASFALARWASQYASTAMTSTSFSMLVASAVACVPCALDELYAAVFLKDGLLPRMRVRVPRRRATELSAGARIADWSEYAAGGGAILLGIALLVAARWSSPVAALHARFMGAFVAAIGVVSLSQVSRSLRWVNAAIGAWLLVAPLLYGYALGGALLAVVIGSLLLLVSVGLGEPADAGPHAASK